MNCILPGNKSPFGRRMKYLFRNISVVSKFITKRSDTVPVKLYTPKKKPLSESG